MTQDQSGSPDSAVESARRSIEQREFTAAATALADVPPTAESAALLGLAHYMQGDYGTAARHYATAANLDPADAEIASMLRLSTANAEADVAVFVPPAEFYDRAELLAAPVVPDGVLPAPPVPIPPTAAQRLRRVAGDGLGWAITGVTEGLIRLTGRIAGYRDDVWTNWYRRQTFLGVLTLGYMRTLLNRNNLINTYPRGTLIGFQERGLRPPPGVTHFRTADGSWNNLKNPKEGAAGTRFPRNARAAAVRPETGDRLLTPNPRVVSRVLLAREDDSKQVPFLNMLAASWINFQNHDWISHGQNLLREVHQIPLPDDDPARVRYHQKHLFVGKTQPDPTRRNGDEPFATSFINEVTHWWDGSQIYGSDQETVDRLRSHQDGKLRVNPDGTLPVDRNGVEESGMVRDWWVGLAMLHNLFVLEHNAICERLKEANPGWDDNRLFQVARLINAAIMAKIHSVEWTPAILPNPALDDALNANWYGVLTNLLRREGDQRTVAPINIRNPEMGGVVGNPINKHGQPYGLTEEFVEVYRLHSLLPEALHLTRPGAVDQVELVPFTASRQAGSPKLTKRYSMSDLFYSFGNQQPGQLVLNNYPRFLLELSIPGNPVYDVAAVDVLRARERGVPRYNEFRRQLGLNPLRTWEDLTDEPEHLARLRQVYGDGPAALEDLDLLVGTLAEKFRPTGFGFGETLFQIFILNASRRLQADRFYTDSYNEETYTAEGLEWIDRADLKSVILRHYPELATTGLGNIKNAFEPWDVGERLEPERHPLRAFDKSLRSNPWRGDAYR